MSYNVPCKTRHSDCNSSNIKTINVISLVKVFKQCLYLFIHALAF